jgi:hypothetical protein
MAYHRLDQRFAYGLMSLRWVDLRLLLPLVGLA